MAWFLFVVCSISLLADLGNTAVDLYQQAAKAINQGDAGSAIRILDQLLEDHPNSSLAPIAVLHLAECYSVESEPESAFQLLQVWQDRILESRKVRQHHENIKTLLKLRLGEYAERTARLKESQSDFVPAIQWLLRAQNHTSEDENRIQREIVRVGILGCQWAASQTTDAQQPGEAVQDFTTRLVQEGLNPLSVAEIQFAFAEQQLKQGHLSLAQHQYNALNRQFEETLAGGANVPDWLSTILLRRCELMVHTGQYREAMQEIETARTTWNALPHGDSKAGTATMEIQLDFLLARCLISRVEFDQARSLLISISKRPDSSTRQRARAHWLIGEVLFLQHECEKALAAYASSMALGPTPWEHKSLLQSGKCRELTGDLTGAIKCYKAAVDQEPESASADFARQRLASIDELMRRTVAKPKIQR